KNAVFFGDRCNFAIGNSRLGPVQCVRIERGKLGRPTMKSLRHALLATASSAALIGTAAADMPVKALAPAVWSWAGPYVGLNAGAAWRNTRFTNPDAFGTFSADPIWTDHGTSFIGGVQIGYNW